MSDGHRTRPSDRETWKTRANENGIETVESDCLGRRSGHLGYEAGMAVGGTTADRHHLDHHLDLLHPSIGEE
jgi:hypothetical protein